MIFKKSYIYWLIGKFVKHAIYKKKMSYELNPESFIKYILKTNY